MADDELDSLYWAAPKDFIAERTRLMAAAKGRGDDAAAKRIAAANKPTTAAWVVNRLALRHTDSAQRLADLGDQLRAAHAAMDGARIRDLSAKQHQLIDELTRAALQAADVSNPSFAVRDDITRTLQAAIAEPEVRERLDELTAAVTAAEREKADADARLSQRRAERDACRQRPARGGVSPAPVRVLAHP